ncbi:MAG: hypothetical protein K8S87_12765 [Planctomycetes bacterium]|nr:hypothetical protein [Planctomycetota bacterium]
MRFLQVTALTAFFCIAFNAPLLAVEKREGFILMSDDTKFEGELLIRTPIKFNYELKGKTKKLMKVQLSEICKIEVSVEFAEQEQTYFFPEEGKKIKEWTGKYSPRKKLSILIYFADGQQIKGTSTFQIYLMQKDEQPRRFDFRKDIHGKEGQTLDELKYIKEIFFSKPAKKTSGKISGTVRVGEKLEKVIAYGRNHQRTFEAKVDADNNTYELKNLPADVYDLCFVCENTIFLSAGALKPDNATDDEEKEITATEKTELNDKIQRQIGRSEFFDRIRVLEVSGWRGSAVAVVLKERIKKTHLDSSDKEHAHLPRRVEIWLLHMTEDDWVIDKRIYLFREVCIDSEPGHLPEIDEKLRGIEINKKNREQTVDLTKTDK